jgi:hypothetical protein
MESDVGKVAYIEFESFLYPVKHWEVLSRFALGEEEDLDPKGLFRLASDEWEAWRYAIHGRQTTAANYRFRVRWVDNISEVVREVVLLSHATGEGREAAARTPKASLYALPGRRVHRNTGLQINR